MFVAGEVIDDRRLQQPVVEIAAAAERPKPALRMREVADHGLRPADLVLRRLGITLLPERNRMRKGVIADPVAFVMRARRQPAALGVAELFADHEERRLDAAFAQDVEHARRHAGLGTIVECQRQVEHAQLRQVAGCRAPAAISSAARWPARGAGLPDRGLALDPFDRGVEGNRHRQHQQHAGEHMRAVENGAVARDQIADAGRRNQHFRHDHADDHERAADAQARQHGRDRRRNDHAHQPLAQRRAHAARGEQQLRIDGLDPGGGRQHRRQEAIDRGERDLGFRADAEPHREHRIEDDQRHRIEARHHRHDQDARPRQAADDGAEQDAAAAGKRHRDRDLIERDGERVAVFAGLVPAGGQRRGQRRQEQFGNEACARQDFPQRDQADHDQSAKRCCGHRLPHADFRICRQMRSRRLPKVSPLSIS